MATARRAVARSARRTRATPAGIEHTNAQEWSRPRHLGGPSVNVRSCTSTKPDVPHRDEPGGVDASRSVAAVVGALRPVSPRSPGDLVSWQSATVAVAGREVVAVGDTQGSVDGEPGTNLRRTTSSDQPTDHRARNGPEPCPRQPTNQTLRERHDGHAPNRHRTSRRSPKITHVPSDPCDCPVGATPRRALTRDREDRRSLAPNVATE